MSEKDNAFTFLKSLQNVLTASLPIPSAMISEMDALSRNGASNHRIRENRFIYHYIIQRLHAHMQTVSGIGAAEATRSLLCEYHAKNGELSSGNPFRRAGAPFGKERDQSASAVMQAWTKTKSHYPINQSYPDIALRDPFPHAVVFDVKYFENDSSTRAEADLVGGVYEVMHYRGLSRVAPTSKSDPGWGYDYGCLLAYDASSDGVLAKAWQAVVSKNAFWEGSNIFVMIIRR